MKHSILKWVLLGSAAIALSVGCGDDGGDGSTPRIDGGGGGGIDAMPVNGGGLAVPATVTMTVNGSAVGAICQTLAIGGGLNYTLADINNCAIGSEIYVTFTGDTPGPYSFAGGTVLNANFDGPAVVFATSSHGTLVNNGQSQVNDVPESTAVTITTADHSFTVSFTGKDATFSAWSDL